MTAAAQCPWPSPELTRVDFLQRDVLFQLPPELHLSAVSAQGAVVGQDEVGVGAVEHGELT